MKRIIALMVFVAAVAVGCKEEGEKAITPSMISNLVATPSEGAITLKWDNPTSGDYLYSRIEYTDPVTGKLKKTNVSHYTNTWTLSGLFRKNGDYTFRVYPVSSTHTIGKDYLEETSRAGAVPPTYMEKEETTKIQLTVEQLAVGPTSAVTDPSEGSLEGLIDGSLSTFWHENWHSKQPFPQFWSIKLGKEVEGVKLKLTTRQHNSNHAIGEAEIYVSNDEDTVTDAEASWTLMLPKDKIGTFPTGNAAVYTTPTASEVTKEGPTRFRRVKLNVLSSSASYWCYSELEVQEVKYEVIDPEL